MIAMCHCLRKPVGRLFWSLLAGAWLICRPGLVRAQMPVDGDYGSHDPSRMIKEGTNYFIFSDGQGISGKTSTDLRNWVPTAPVFPGNPPAWTTNAVAGFTGYFWAPDIVCQNGLYYLYYAASEWGTINSAIGLVTTPSLLAPVWTDQGMVIRSVPGTNEFNAIDPGILQDTNGAMWLTFGSYSDGIFITQLNPATGLPLNAANYTRIANNGPVFFSSTEEASFPCQHGGYYYLFDNWGGCCAGIDSTYNIRVGRSTNVAGPYLDRNGTNLVNGGGTMFLEGTARFVGPGQAGIMNDNGTNWLTYHYYDGNNYGAPTLGLGQLTWSADGWPVFTNDWSALYTFNTDAREHLGLYNGTLENGAVITNEPGRGKVLSLNGGSQYVLLPDPVANASTFAGWVKWNGGPAWQRIFDFGSGTGTYLFLTPAASDGNLRFAITTNGDGAEQRIEAPFPLPVNSWCHVAVTLDGATGLLYLDGLPVATNSSLTIRPWQTLARTNYIGHSQFPADPLFGGEIDSFRVFGRALSASEIRGLAYAHPALAHRYSFTNNAWDSIGMAHGALCGGAVATNGALVLNGSAGGYVSLPGGLLSGSAAATIEFWAAFGTNGNWARVFDFGTNAGGLGQNFIFFTPHNSSGAVQMGVATTGGAQNLVAPGTYDNRALHVVCIADPANGYSAVYTNGVLEMAQTNAFPALTNVSPAWSFIGRSLFSADAWLSASIAELRIYDGRLTPQEIAADYQFGPDQLALPITLAQSNAPANWTLSWPAYAAGFVPESVAELGGGTNWMALPQTPVLGNNYWKITLAATNAAQFYRLSR